MFPLLRSFSSCFCLAHGGRLRKPLSQHLLKMNGHPPPPPAPPVHLAREVMGLPPRAGHSLEASASPRQKKAACSHPCCRSKRSANGLFRVGLELIICQKTESAEVAPHKRMRTTKGQQQMLNNGVGTSSIHGLRLFLCLPQMVPHFSPATFNFKHSYFCVHGKRERGIWTGFRLMFSALGLNGASSVSLPNGDMCLQSFGIVAPSRPVLRRWLYFHAERK